MPILKPLFQKEISQDPKSWAKRFQVPESQISKLLNGKWSIQMKTAEKFQVVFNQIEQTNYSIEELFEVSELKGIDDREVEYEFWVEPMNDEEKVGIIRYLFEKRKRAHMIRDAVIFFLILGLLMSLVSYVAKHYF